MMELCDTSRELADTFIIREAKPEDSDDISCMLKDLIRHDFKLKMDIPISGDNFRSDGFERQLFRCMVAEETSTKRKPAGLIIFFCQFCSKDGFYIFLQTLYVVPEFRQNGIGTMLLQELARTTLSTGCSKIVWNCFIWQTKTVDFYLKTGAINYTESEGAIPYRIRKEGMKRIIDASTSIETVMVRKVLQEDFDSVLDVIKNSQHPGENLQLDEETYRRYGFGPKKLFNCIVAEEAPSHEILGVALCTSNYTYYGNSVFIEHISVPMQHRHRGIEKGLIEEVAKEAWKEGHRLIDVVVNKGDIEMIALLESFGATSRTDNEDIHRFYLSGNNLKCFAEKK